MPTSTRKKWPVYCGFPAKPCWFSILRRRGGRPCQNCPVLWKSDANPQHFNGPMWASAPTNIHEKSTNFEGGQSRPPLQMTVDNFDSLSSVPTNGRKNRILHRSPLQTALALPKQTVRSTEPSERTVFIAALQGCSGSGEASAQNRSPPDAPLWTGPSRPCVRAAPGGSHNSRSDRTGCTVRSGARAHTWT